MLLMLPSVLGFFWNNFVPRPITFQPPKWQEQVDYNTMLEQTLNMIAKNKRDDDVDDEDEEEDKGETLFPKDEGNADVDRHYRKLKDNDLPRSHIIKRRR